MASYRSGTAAPDASWLWHRRNRGWLTLSGSEDRDEQQENARPPGLYGDFHRLVTLVGCRINNDQSARRAPRRERGGARRRSLLRCRRGADLGVLAPGCSTSAGSAVARSGRPMQTHIFDARCSCRDPGRRQRRAPVDRTRGVWSRTGDPERPLTVDVSLPAAEDTTDTHQDPEYRDVELPAWRSVKGYPKVSARSSAIARRRQAGASRVPVTPLDSARPQ